MNNIDIYSVGRNINIKENKLYSIRNKIIRLLNENEINWILINKLSNESIEIINSIDKLRKNRIEMISNS